jgi:hypothetical protein
MFHFYLQYLFFLPQKKKLLAMIPIHNSPYLSTYESTNQMQIVAQALHHNGNLQYIHHIYLFILIGQIQITQINHISSS